MCQKPIYIPNPNKGAKLEGLNLLKDCTNSYLKIPCGHCEQCLAVRQMELVQRALCEQMFNHLFFCTLTYKDTALPVMNIGGYNISYAKFDDVQNMFKRIRKYSPYPFRYEVVSEFGSTFGRPHFHILLSVPMWCGEPSIIEKWLYDTFFFEWRRNIGSSRKPVYEPCFEFHRSFRNGRMTYNFDLHYVDPQLSSCGEADVAFYILKYMLKGSKRENRLQQALHLNLQPEVYQHLWKQIKSKLSVSKGFGLINQKLDFEQRKTISSKDFNPQVVAHIRKGIEFGKGKFPYPTFINKYNGQTFPLSPFYRKYFITEQDAWDYYFENDKLGVSIDNSDPIPSASLTAIKNMEDKYKRKLQTLDSKSFY